MQLVQRIHRYAALCAAVLVLGACAGQKAPAGKLVADIEATVTAASGEAAQYVPEQLAEVQSKLGTLKAGYDKQDYAGVMMQGPAVLSAAQGLATAAAAKKDEILKALGEEWAGLSAALPGDMTAIQNRIELLSKKSSKKRAAGIDLLAAKSGVSDAAALWSKAQAAFSAGNLQEAVTTAKAVKEKSIALAASLQLDLAAPAAAPGLGAAK